MRHQTEKAPAAVTAGADLQTAPGNTAVGLSDSPAAADVPQFIGYYQTKRNQLFWGRLPAQFGVHLVCIRGSKEGVEDHISAEDLKTYYDEVSEEVARG